MENKDKRNDEMLSFEDLRKKVGIDNKNEGDGNKSPQENKVINTEELFSGDETPEKNDNDLFNEIDKNIDMQVDADANGDKIIVNNGKTFIDITERYVDKSSEENVVEVKTEKPKKKVRTFNEMFSSFFGKIFPNKHDSTKEKVRKIVMDISVVVIVACLIGFGELYRQRRVELNLEEDLKNQIIDDIDKESGEYFEKWKEVLAKYPNVKFPEGMNLKYSYLYALNQDLVGWIRIKNTSLDVQVVKTVNNDFYHRRNFYKKNSRYGTPYMDYRCDPRYLSDNTVIYGHHMSDGLMFSNLDRYKTLDGYKEAPVIQFDTLYETHYFKVFAAFITNIEESHDNGQRFNYSVSKFDSDESFTGFIEEAKKRSLINTTVNVQPDDKIITLATCTYDFSNARLVVMGRLLRPNESLYVDVDRAQVNPTPKYPQAWYDAKGLDNPYKDDKTWTLK